MERIVIQVRDKNKAKLLSELLRALEFVEFVNETSAKATETSSLEEEGNFFSLAGLWEGRDIDLGVIRRQAWPRGAS